MNFSDQSRYDRNFQQVTNKGGESALNYITIFQNAQDLSVLVGSTYSEDQILQILLNNLYQGRKYSAKIDSYHAQLRREETFTDQGSLSISSL